MKTFARILLPLVMFLPLLASAAEDAGTINRRMIARLPAIDALKERKVVGENNAGYLEVRGTATAEDQKLVSSENSDRKAVYELIANQQSTSADAVGRARARQIAERSKPGVLLQSPDGKWYEKR